VSDLIIERDVVYGHAGARALRLDVYRPAQGQGDTAIMLVHGGGWTGGNKAMLAEMAGGLAREGYPVFAPEYRLTGEAPWPAQIHDVKRALGWVRAAAGAYAFDPDKICAQGHSAGAHLVLLAAGTPGDQRLDPADAATATGAAANIAAVAAFYPPTILFVGDQRPSGGTAARALKGADASSETAALASPITHVHRLFPPTLLLHGDEDKVVPVSATRRFEEALRAAGGRADLHVFAGLPHGFANNAALRPALVATLAAFYGRHVRTPAAFAQPAPLAGPAPRR
jgi:acetyl esterase/lipase